MIASVPGWVFWTAELAFAVMFGAFVWAQIVIAGLRRQLRDAHREFDALWLHDQRYTLERDGL